RAVAVLEEAVRRFPADVESKRLLALALNNLGAGHLFVGAPQEALKRLGRSADLDRELFAAAPADSRPRADLARTLYNTGRIQLALGRYSPASKPLEEADRLASALARENPRVTVYAEVRAEILERRGALEAARGRAAKARGLLRDCLELKDEVTGTHAI